MAKRPRSRVKILESILDSISVGIFWKDANLRYVGCNQAFAEDAGLTSPDEIFGKTDFELYWANSAHIYRKSDKEIIATGNPKLESVEPVDSPDGKSKWVKTSKIPMKARNGKVIGILGLTQDITEQREKELERFSLEGYYKTIFEEAPTAIIEEDYSLVLEYVKKLQAEGITDLDTYLSDNPGQLLYCLSLAKPLNANRSAVRLFGAPDKKTLLQMLTDRRRSGKVDHSNLPTLKNAILKALDGEYEFEIRQLNRKFTGESFPVLVQTTVPPPSRKTWKKNIQTVIDLTPKPAKDDYSMVIPICSSCKQLRDEEGHWVEIEEYMPSVCECGFTHGLCPDCVKKLYKDFF